MHHLKIKQLGPIDYCELDCADFMTFTGMQASGKSTIAKSIYFFRTIKDDVLNLINERAISRSSFNSPPHKSLKLSLIAALREKFMQTFGSSWGMPNDMELEYVYSEGVYIKVYLVNDSRYGGPNYIWIDLGSKNSPINQFLELQNNSLWESPVDEWRLEQDKTKKELETLFDDAYSVVYIPAGRSVLTLLSDHLLFIYSKMDDAQKRKIDLCTQDYIERILKLKPSFSSGIHGFGSRLNRTEVNQLRDKLEKLFDGVLRGSYLYQDGEERIYIPSSKNKSDSNRYVKLNFASSGQQEAVWICNLLAYYLLESEKTLFIIEEPESHLFPESQKYMVELIALVHNHGNRTILTTHSPYVLGTLNNLLYAHSLQQSPNKEKVNTIISQDKWLSSGEFGAWFVQNGGLEFAMEPELNLISNEKIDGVSAIINGEYDSLSELEGE